jgi:glutathione S-transferase
LEKDIPFEPVLVRLNKGEQRQPEFIALNPFQHVPVIVDGDLRLIESLAILDYLEGKYPTPSLLPQSIDELAKMRMIQMVTVNELMPKISKLLRPNNEPIPEDIVKHLDTTLQFLNNQLNDCIYFGGENLNLADIVVGATVPLFCRLGLELKPYPALNHWHQNITTRKAWIETKPNDQDFNAWKRWLQLMIQRSKKLKATEN